MHEIETASKYFPCVIWSRPEAGPPHFFVMAFVLLLAWSLDSFVGLLLLLLLHLAFDLLLLLLIAVVCCLVVVAWCLLPIIPACCLSQLPIASCPHFYCLLHHTNCPLPSACSMWPVSLCLLRPAWWLLHNTLMAIAYCPLFVADCLLPLPCCLLPTCLGAYSLLLITYYVLPIGHGILHLDYCLLPFISRLLPTASVMLCSAVLACLLPKLPPTTSHRCLE